MHIHVWRNVGPVHGPYTGSRFGVSGWQKQRCRCGIKQTVRVGVRRITRERT